MNTKLKFLFDIQKLLQGWGLAEPQARAVNIAVGIVFILFLAYLSDIVLRRSIVFAISRLVARTRTIWDDILFEKRVFNRLSHLAPSLVLWHSAGYVLSGYGRIRDLVQPALTIYMIIITLLVLNSFLKAVNEIYNSVAANQGRSIRGYIQVVQIIFYSVAIILVISILSGVPPGKLLTGLGAMAAVLMLVFKDTILGLVAGIQLSANDMVRIGDWITMPKYGADGNVLEITLNTVKVRNFDKTITMVPTYALVSDSFINWRGTEEVNARRFKKSISIDMHSIFFFDKAGMERFQHITGTGSSAFSVHADSTGNAFALHEGEVTNLTVFRRYVSYLLNNHPSIDKDLTRMVRELQPAASGIPVEIIAFTTGTDAQVFEEVQSEIFDHLLAVLPEFGLRVFQSVSVSFASAEA